MKELFSDLNQFYEKWKGKVDKEGLTKCIDESILLHDYHKDKDELLMMNLMAAIIASLSGMKLIQDVERKEHKEKNNEI